MNSLVKRKNLALSNLESAHIEIEAALFQLVQLRGAGRAHELAVGALDAVLDTILELNSGRDPQAVLDDEVESCNQ